jgi:hypothetical protein
VTSAYFVIGEQVPVAGVEPRLAPARWAEVGVSSITGFFGPQWQVIQVGHPFTQRGQPVSFNPSTGAYAGADARFANRAAVAVVREIVSPTEFILQASGELPVVDATVLVDPLAPAPSDPNDAIEAGRLYYVASTTGRIQRADPSLEGWASQPVLAPTTRNQDGSWRAVIVPWGPSGRLPPVRSGSAPPPNATIGQLWFRTGIVSGLYVAVESDDGLTWVQANV